MIDRIDHIVLTVKDMHATCDFYVKALGMEVVTFGAGRTALAFGAQKINLHAAGATTTRSGGGGVAGQSVPTLVSLLRAYGEQASRNFLRDGIVLALFGALSAWAIIHAIQALAG